MINRILLTGAAGKLGRRLRAPLSKLCTELVVSDLLPLQAEATNERAFVCDLSDTAAVGELLQGVDAVVHFAGYPREASWHTLVPANLLSTVNLWEQGVRAGVQRIVYASSNHVTGFHPTDRIIGLEDEVKADSRYGVTKAFTETLARFYYEKFGLQSLGIRIGRCEDSPTDERMFSTWIHPDDLNQIVRLGLTHPVAADLIYGVSRNSKGWWRNPAQPAVPYLPAYSADDYLLDPASPPGERYRYQGGHFATGEYGGDPERAARNSH